MAVAAGRDTGADWGDAFTDLQSALAAYGTGKEEFLTLIDIERMLVTAKQEYHMAAMSLLDSQSQLERAVGIAIEEMGQSLQGGRQ